MWEEERNWRRKGEPHSSGTGWGAALLPSSHNSHCCLCTRTLEGPDGVGGVWPLPMPPTTRPQADAPIPHSPPHRDADHHRLHLGAASLLQVPPGEEWAGSPASTHLGWVVGRSGNLVPQGLVSDFWRPVYVSRSRSMRLKSIRLRPGGVSGLRGPGKGLRVCGCGTKERGRGRAVGISWTKKRKDDREPRGPEGGDALVGYVVRQVS